MANLTNDIQTYAADADYYGAAGDGILSIVGGGSLNVAVDGATIQLRQQENLQVIDPTNSVVIDYPAATLNTNLTSNAVFDTTNDRWKFTTDPNSGDANHDSNVLDWADAVNGQDIKLIFTAEDIATNKSGTEVNGTPETFFSNFVTQATSFAGTNGVGELLFADEVLNSSSVINFEAAKFAAVLNDVYNTASTGETNESFFTGSNTEDIDGNTINTSETVTYTYVPFHILNLNQVLRKMADFGYNNRTADYNYGSNSPFLAGDIISITNGFSMNVNVTVAQELGADPANFTGSNLASLSTLTVPLFIRLT